ncbi:MAG: 23S rRNA (pseudouridine(1915)-N(3))-methyltransferase RlmH [Coriobacteriaceae bacterium]|nr:23S rRNA (pseudouridine(1915)-N(3))-methyltransferase RlmH [Coriobacteriaceae bacterium]MDO4889926.1 23S rRNA (pseudouridine(1915)-N(3))-methyltransferase RlmH [Coriobacteriaceae bacterium]
MQKTTIIAVGKLKERFWKDACAEYLKRLSAYTDSVVREVPDSTPEREEAAILAALDKLPDGTHVILLDIRGKETSSEALAQKLETLAVNGASHVAFIIGGSDGVTAAVRARANERMSFGPITLPHNLARVVLLEQVYRAHKIIRREPYHK